MNELERKLHSKYDRSYESILHIGIETPLQNMSTPLNLTFQRGDFKIYSRIKAPYWNRISILETKLHSLIVTYFLWLMSK